MPARGLFYGNRGGRFHRDDRTLGASRWKTRQWIVCLCEFKGRKNEVFGRRYTDLFFLDEPTAFAAGHRPCFYCRRNDASTFVGAIGNRDLLRAPALDTRLDAERRDGREKRLHVLPIDHLPDGAMFAVGDSVWALRGDAILPWSFRGYGACEPRPRGVMVSVLTPPTILRALAGGYTPEWHPSAAV